MSTRKAVSIGLVVLLHVALGYAFITGLAYNVIKKAATDLKVVDVKDEPPPPEQKPPPPPPQQKVEPPPVSAPPPLVSAPTIAPPTIVMTQAPVIQAAPPAPPPPPPPTISKAAGPKGNPADWITSEDYPPGAQRQGIEGTTEIAWQINEQGRVENCHTLKSSGNSELDEAACRLMTRRGRYTPAKDQNGNPIRSTDRRRVVWKIPRD